MSTVARDVGEKSPARTRSPLRFVSAASLFDGHDAAINIMRRLIQAQGVEVVHLGHNRSVDDIVRAAIQVIDDMVGDILAVDVDRGPAYRVWHADLSTDLGYLRGIEHFMLDMMDRPDWLHEVLGTDRLCQYMDKSCKCLRQSVKKWRMQDALSQRAWVQHGRVPVVRRVSRVRCLG